MLLFDDKKILIDVVVRWQQDIYDKEAREDIKENPEKYTGECTRWKVNVEEGWRESKTEPV